MMNGIGSAIMGVFITIIIVAFVIGGLAAIAMCAITHTNYIESKTIITPEIKLQTDGKTIDTLYIYKKQK